MERPWLQQYPPGVPHEVDLRGFASLTQMIAHSCERFGARPALTNLGSTLSYADLDRLGRAFAAYLQQAAGLRRGERVALMLPNLLQYPVALLGVLRAGCTVVNVNPLYTARELEYQLADSGAAAIVVLENFAHVLEQVVARTAVRTVVVTRIGDLLPRPKAWITHFVVKHVKKLVPAFALKDAVAFEQALRLGSRLVLDPVDPRPDDIAFLQYTGGTTGVAKGAVLLQRNMLANVEQLAAWIARDLRDGEEVGVLPLPLYHAYALTVWFTLARIGARVVLVTNPRDLDGFVATLRSERFSLIVGVNTLYNALLDHRRFAEVDFAALKVACAGGMAVQRAVAERWKRTTGVPLIEGYGLTEASPVVTSNRLDIADWTGAIGYPLPGTDVAVLDDAGRPLPLGEIGEIAVRGPQVMQGYWNRPAETAKVFTPDGWLLTGDMGCMDGQGAFRITDRKKDLIIVSGFKVFPNEVEDVAVLHPGVAEAAAIGMADAKSGEAVKLVVLRRDPALSENELIEHCRRQLTGYKVPKRIEFRSEPLPKSPIGKILRRTLRPET